MSNLCRITKFKKKNFISKVERSSESLSLIHYDIGDLEFIQTRGGQKYYIIFIDNCIRYCYTYLLIHKDEAFKMFKYYKNEVKNHLNKKIKTIKII